MEARLSVSGMHCGSCAARIEKTLRQIPGVSEANVNFATKRAKVVGDVTIDQVLGAIRSLGYNAEQAQLAGKPTEIAKGRSKRIGSLDDRSRLLISTVLSVPVFILGMFHIEFPGHGVVQLVLTTLVLVGPGRGFFERSYGLIKHGGVNMDTLIALGVGAAYLYSLVSFIVGGPYFYFESAAMIVTLVLLGHALEDRAKHRAAEAIRKLQELQVKTATMVLPDGGTKDVPVEHLRPGDIFIVSPGEKVATDGDVVAGESSVDESMISGEPMPVPRGLGQPVIGATLNTGPGRLKVKATRLGRDTVLAQIVTLVQEAQASKAQVQRLADTVSAYFVPAVLAVALLTLLFWKLVLMSTWAGALVPAVAVLVIACPCALGLATPTAILAGSGRAAEKNILIRSAAGLERAERVTTLVIDKTGTLTEGRPAVSVVHRAHGIDVDEALRLAAAASSSSKHPMARAVVDYVENRRLSLAEVLDFEERTGQGVEARVRLAPEAKDSVCLVGQKSFLESSGVRIPPPWLELEHQPHHLLYGAVDGMAAVLLVLEDPIRASSIKAATALREMGVRIVMATGDCPEPARKVADALGIQEVWSRQTPADKAVLVRELQERGEQVAMVGDGINDAPALAAADVGMALTSATDVAVTSATVIIPHGDLAKVAELIHLSKRTMAVIKQNLAWAFLYNVFAIPVAAAGLLSPMIAAGAMALSSVSVVGNSLRLRRL